MAITSSVVTVGHAQIDGRRWVREVHSDAQGEAQTVDYLGSSDAATTAQGIANTRATVLNLSLADAECVYKLSVDASPAPLRWQTAAEFADRMRAIYRSATKEQLARLAIWVTRRIDLGQVTALQFRTAFGLTAGQWTTLETKMRTLRTNQEAVDAAVGE
jgi:hypothetical protein